MCKIVNVVHLPVLRAEESLCMTPHRLDGVRVGSSTLINKASAGFDPCIYNGLHSVRGSVRNENEKRFTTLVLNTAKHPLPHNRLAPVIFAPTELAVVDIDGLVRTAHLLRAALHVHQQGLQNGPQTAVVLGVKR